ncbi:MAG TPA: DUF6152 family protein [Gammaproteobacteria bacterium]
MEKRRATCFHAAVVAAASIMSLSAAWAHHSVSAYFDTSQVIEVQGELTDVRWQNPHVGFSIDVRGENGEVTEWQISSTSVSHLGRLGLTGDMFTLGEIVTFAGSPSRRSIPALQATNMLRAGGEEIALNTTGRRHWSSGVEEYLRVTPADVGARDDGEVFERSLFRVWSTPTRTADRDPIWEDSYPLTAEARAAQAAWDPITDNPVILCVGKGMPSIMNPPYPMELIDRGDVIVYRQEEFDSVRTIYMNPATTPAPEPSNMGHSVGRWEGETLVVDTILSTWPYFDGQGIPISSAAEYEERFTLSDDGKRLDYTVLITDMTTFTEPVLLDRFWLWVPGVQVEPYECTP